MTQTQTMMLTRSQVLHLIRLIDYTPDVDTPFTQELVQSLITALYQPFDLLSVKLTINTAVVLARYCMDELERQHIQSAVVCNA